MSIKPNIYFTCPTDLIVQNFELYFDLVKHIKLKGHITYDWIRSAFNDLKKADRLIDPSFNDQKINGINEADCQVPLLVDKKSKWADGQT